MQPLRLHDRSRTPQEWTAHLSATQYAVFLRDADTRVALDPAGQSIPANVPAVCYCFESLADAETFCNQKIAACERMLCEIYDRRGKAIDPIRVHAPKPGSPSSQSSLCAPQNPHRLAAAGHRSVFLLDRLSPRRRPNLSHPRRLRLLPDLGASALVGPFRTRHRPPARIPSLNRKSASVKHARRVYMDASICYTYLIHSRKHRNEME